MNIGELRMALGKRIDDAFFRQKPTVIHNAQKGEPRAALIPYAWYEELLRLRAESAGPAA